MSIDLSKIESRVRARFEAAQQSLMKLAKSMEFCESQAISDTIPGYEANQLDFATYLEDNFAVLFVDMRNSTPRAKTIGAQKTFLSMHAFIPGLLEVVEYYNGYVIDIMGDGIMVFFGGKQSGISKSIACQNAGLCGQDMLLVVDKVVNKILLENDIMYKIAVGVGCDYGNVIVTKIGTDKNYDTKAYGDCINTASKYSDSGASKVKVSKQIKEHWPEGKNGKIKFISEGDGYLLNYS